MAEMIVPDAVERLSATARLWGQFCNDAPALAQAHVGIAMDTGTDVATKART